MRGLALTWVNGVAKTRAPVVKCVVIRKTETRFAGYEEIKEQDGKRDRAMEEIFLRENRVPLRELPLEDFNQEWLKSHRPALKKNSKKDVAIETFFKNDIAKQQFWTA